MNSNDAARAYRNESIENAPPLKLVRLLYQAAIRQLDLAIASSPKDPSSPFIDSLSRADGLVSELRLALQRDHSPELVDNLEQLYLFVEDSLQRAMRDRSADGLVGARRVLATLLEGWAKIEVDERKAATERGAA